MFQKLTTFLFLAMLLLGSINCSKKEEIKDSSPKLEKKVVKKSSSQIKSSQAIQKPTVSPILENNNTLTANSSNISANSPKKESAKTIAVPASYKIYNNLSIIINAIKTGQTVTTDQLLATNKIPEDAGKTVKSITKVSENEMDIKWKSKWMIEKMSDVELEDSRLKVKFKNGIVYTSGNAIGINYDGKVYNTLIIKGDRAYIPGVKKYSWKIGR